MIVRNILMFILLICLHSFCFLPDNQEHKDEEKDIIVAQLGEDTKGFDKIKMAFTKANPGYTVDFLFQTLSTFSNEKPKILFIQSGSGTASIDAGKRSKFSIGDVIVLHPGESLSSDSSFSSLVFEVPESPSQDIPSFVRPDWDKNITDIPGGCATETNAYRRILLTWKKEIGNYVYHQLNAHRVRIMDSFSHYHPVKGGFDEFYLVQMVLPGAKLITSNQVSKIEKPLQISKEEIPNLLQETQLKIDDVVYIPRGVMHRGVGGVLAQVITIPGFIPGAEIGVDHHLREINNHLNIKNKNLIPYNLEASSSTITK